MVAIVIQQKIIGEHFASRKVSIRHMVGVNSLEIRAVRNILEQPGMNIRKVSVLCGGPDWPVSVLTGILRLPLLSMLYGSLPVFFLIAPCVMAGAFLLRASENGLWGSISTMTLAVTVLVQSGAMLAAIHFIAKTAIDNEKVLLALPADEEVLKRESAVEEKLKLRTRVSAWGRLGLFHRVLLAFAAACMTGSCYVFQLFGSRCFKSFEVSDPIDTILNGEPIIKDLGLAGLALFFVPCIVLSYFQCLISHLMRKEQSAASNTAITTSHA